MWAAMPMRGRVLYAHQRSSKKERGEKLKKYYSLVTNGKEADIYIFGDIVDPLTKELWGLESDTSGLSLANDVKDLDVDVINVHINSYGGSVSEGLAIYNTLKNHKAKIRTYCDGFACSAASVVFMAGDERLMNDASLLMIHNAWMYTAGNAAQLRKDADDLEKITQGSIEAYTGRVSISEEEVKRLMDAETWILPGEAVEWGFATGIIKASESGKAAASAQKALFSIVAGAREPQGITADEIAEKLFARIKAEATETPPAEPPAEPPTDPPPAEPPQENKTIKFFNALMGGKE